MSSFPTGKPFARLSDFALDPTSVYENFLEAAEYASNSPVAYLGQLLGVREGSTCNVYVIEPNRTLKRIGSADDSTVPVDGFIEPAGLNQSMLERQIAATNTIIAQMKFEDEQRQKILAAVSPSAQTSDDLPTLLAHLGRCSAKLSQFLLKQGIREAAGSPLETLMDRLGEIGTADEPISDSDLIAKMVERLGRDLFQKLAKPYMNNGKNKSKKNGASVLMVFRDEER
jgi:hypothetical protein